MSATNPNEAIHANCGMVKSACRCYEPRTPAMSREQLHARISDVLRRSGVSDAEQLIRAMECDVAGFREALTDAWAVIANASGGNWTKEPEAWQDFARKWHDETLLPALRGRSIGPPKPASEQAE